MGGLSSAVCSSTDLDSAMMMDDRMALDLAAGLEKNCMDFTSSVCTRAQKKSYMNMENRLMQSLSSFLECCVMSVLAAVHMAADVYISVALGICSSMCLACPRHVCGFHPVTICMASSKASCTRCCGTVSMVVRRYCDSFLHANSDMISASTSMAYGSVLSVMGFVFKVFCFCSGA